MSKESFDMVQEHLLLFDITLLVNDRPSLRTVAVCEISSENKGNESCVKKGLEKTM